MIWREIYFGHRQTHFERRRVIDIIYAVYSIAILGLLLNAMGIFVEPNLDPYELAATWLLVNAIIVFISALERFLHPPEKGLS